MVRRIIDQTLISDDVENLDIHKLKKAYKRYKSDTSGFKRKNVRDPIDHLDFELNLQNELRELQYRIECGDYYPKRPLIHYSPKKNGISRPTVSLRIEDVIVYRFCIEQIDEELVAITRQKNIRGGVMASPMPAPEDGEYYEKWFKDWLDHNEEIKRALGTRKKKYIATSDISSYFDNVDIDVLIDMLRETVKGKRNLLSLLSFFLHGVKLRYTYATKLNTGLVQDDSDGSRILAYFYLHPHDIRMINFTNDAGGYFFRYVDDMNVVVTSKADAQLALKTLTDSLRKLSLISSIEKTSILTDGEALAEMRYMENDEIGKIEAEIDVRLRQGKQTSILAKRLEGLYSDFINRGLSEKSSWIKILRRFYTLATRLRTDFLLDDLGNHLEQYPSLAATGKLQRYFIANQESSKFDKSVCEILQYCNSKENLYPQVETELIELLCSIELEKTSISTQLKIQDLAQRMAINGAARAKEPQSDFSRAMAFYLLYKCDPSSNLNVAQQYIQSFDESEYVRKSMALVSLTCDKSDIRKEVLNKIRSDTSIEMKRLAYMMTNLKKLRSHPVLQKYKTSTKFFLWGDKWKDDKGKIQKKEIKLHYMPIRVRILRDILRVNR